LVGCLYYSIYLKLNYTNPHRSNANQNVFLQVAYMPCCSLSLQDCS